MADRKHDNEKDVSSALLDLWKAIVLKLPELRDYDRVYLTDGDHVQRLATKYFRRAARLRWCSFFVILGAFAIIVYGIWIFLRPTEFADLGAAKRTVDQAQSEIGEIRREIAAGQSDVARKRDIRNLYGSFYEVLAFLQAYKPGQSVIRDNPAIEPPLRVAVGAAEQLGAANPTKIVVPFKNYMYFSDQATDAEIPSETFATEGKKLAALAIAPASLRDGLKGLLESIGTESESEHVSRVVADLRPLKAQLDSAKQEYQVVLNLADEHQRNSRNTEEQAQVAAQTINTTLLEASRPLSPFAGSDTWLPMLTIRVGVVILLLYITKALLETYRYTLTLAAYYAARGDALQMLSSRPTNCALDVNEFAIIVPLLSPDTYRIDRIVSPDEAIVSASKSK